MVEQGIPIVHACVDKKKMVEKYKKPINPHIMSFVQVGEMVERWMGQWARGQYWIPCVGANDHNREIEGMFLDCRNFGAPFGYWSRQWTRAADVMAFTSPEKSKIFGFSDLAAFAISRHRQQKEHWGVMDKLQPHIFASKIFPT
jgi:hypothetical protein